MSVCLLLKSVTSDLVGQENTMRTIGTREPPPRIAVQIDVTGTAQVQLQGKICREAPWLNLGPSHAESALTHIQPVQFLRAVTSGMAAGASVSVWAVWGW